MKNLVYIMDLHFQKLPKTSKNFQKICKKSMRNATEPELVYHLEFYTFYWDSKAGKHPVNYVISCKNF